ncbi:MAG TPA: DUF4912 domain-containing protein [Eubacteriaceae bacterium]|nr:DUF4912 domain-containing protein [Eubacteriaceae bacterium]
MENNSKIVLQQISPHILHIKWKLDNSLKEIFSEKFGEWWWKKSKPMLKICINDFNIIGEQDAFYLNLKEEDRESVIYVSSLNKTYCAQYGRCLGKFIFLPIINSNRINLLIEDKCTIIKLPVKLV